MLFFLKEGENTMKIKKILTIIVVVFVSSISYASSKLTIVHMNDTHGHIENFPAIAKQVDKIRAEVKRNGGEVLLTHSGDFNTGTPESDLLQAEPDIAHGCPKFF